MNNIEEMTLFCPFRFSNPAYPMPCGKEECGLYSTIYHCCSFAAIANTMLSFDDLTDAAGTVRDSVITVAEEIHKK